MFLQRQLLRCPASIYKGYVINFTIPARTNPTIRQLKPIMVAITKYKGVSGRHWDDENGANIGDADKGPWDNYVLGNPIVSPCPLITLNTG